MSTVDTKNPYKYSVYGLTLGVNRCLLGLIPASSNAKVDVTVDLFGKETTELPISTENIQHGAEFISEDGIDYYHLWFVDSGRLDFKIEARGTQITANWTRNLATTWDRSAIAEVTSLLLGQVSGYTLRLRGTLCLHGCVIKVGDYAVAFIGESGAGKSTMAAAMANKGHAILADDIAAFQEQEDYFLVQPGYPSVRLWPKSVNAVYGSEVGLNKIFSNSEKRFLELDQEDKESPGKFYDQPLPIAAIYVLGARKPELSAPSIEVIPPVMATMNLMTHRSVGHLKLDREREAQEFAGFGRIAATVPVRKIVRSEDLTALPQICELIEQDVARLVMDDRCPQS